MKFKFLTSPHIRGQGHVWKVMLKVLLALLPGAAVSTYFWGWGVVTNVLLAVLAAVLVEALILVLRRRPFRPALLDLSAVVTACLLALAIPAYAPWWLPVVGVIFAIVFGKQLYGGLGYNPFNPAMLGYIVLLVSFPAEMSRWLVPGSLLGLTETLTYIFSGDLGSMGFDGLSGATALDYLKTQLGQGKTLSDMVGAPVYGTIGSYGWEWVALAYALGGMGLIALKVMPWHAPVAMLVSLFLMAQMMHYLNADAYSDGVYHLFSGGTMLGAFFIITDPVSGCTSRLGRCVFGAGVGVLVYIMRAWGSHPDGIAFAVLLMNMAAPLIDSYTKPRVFGVRVERG